VIAKRILFIVTNPTPMCQPPHPKTIEFSIAFKAKSFWPAQARQADVDILQSCAAI
jgi:hypothetical protein